MIKRGKDTNSLHDEESIWESGVSRDAFFLRGLDSIIFRIIYLLFSLYWIYRGYLLRASYLFVLMGLFFLLSSLYLLLSPWLSAGSTKYVVTSKRLIVPGAFGMPLEIDIKDIIKIRRVWSFFDERHNCASFEVDYLAGEDKTSSIYRMTAVKRYDDLERIFDKLVERSRMPKNPVGNKESREEDSMPNKVNKKVVAIALAILILVMVFGFLFNYHRDYVIAKDMAQIDGINTIYLYAELNKPLEDKNLIVGLYGPHRVDCCKQNIDNTSLLLFYPYDDYNGANTTMYLFDRFTEKPMLDESKEYISRVYLCVRTPQSIGQGRDISLIFGNKPITKSTCKYRWVRESCCIEWHNPS